MQAREIYDWNIRSKFLASRRKQANGDDEVVLKLRAPDIRRQYQLDPPNYRRYIDSFQRTITANWIICYFIECSRIALRAFILVPAISGFCARDNGGERIERTSLRYLSRLIIWRHLVNIVTTECRLSQGSFRIISSPSFSDIISEIWQHILALFGIDIRFPRACHINIDWGLLQNQHL